MRRRPEASHSKFTGDRVAAGRPRHLCAARTCPHAPPAVQRCCKSSGWRGDPRRAQLPLPCISALGTHARCVGCPAQHAATAIPYDSRLALRLHPDKNERQRDSAPKESAWTEDERRDNARLKAAARDQPTTLRMSGFGLGAEHSLPKRVRTVLGRSLGLFWPS